jgi:hypothetical protein
MNLAPDQIAPERISDATTTPQARAIRRVRLVAAARAAFLHDLWSREETRDEAPLSRLTDPGDNAQGETLYRACNDTAAALTAEAAALAEALAVDETGGRFARMARVFGLGPADQALVHLAFAAESDPGLPAILAHVAPDGVADWPTPALAARLFGIEGWQADGAAARWHLLRRVPQGGGRPDRIALADGLAEWLAGSGPAAPQLLDIAETVAPGAPLPGWPVTSLAADLRRVLETGPGAPVTVALDGVAGAGRRMFAAAVCDRLDLELLAVDLSRVAPGEMEAALRWRIARRGSPARRCCCAGPPVPPACRRASRRFRWSSGSTPPRPPSMRRRPSASDCPCPTPPNAGRSGSGSAPRPRPGPPRRSPTWPSGTGRRRARSPLRPQPRRLGRRPPPRPCGGRTASASASSRGGSRDALPATTSCCPSAWRGSSTC